MFPKNAWYVACTPNEIDDKLVCGYHGLEMGCGKTIAMPGQRVRGFPAIRSYPTVERRGFVWVWPGDPAARRVP